MKILEENEIKPGMKVTVYEWLSHRDFSWIGDVIEVLAVDGPFVAAKLPRYEAPHVFDLRKVRLAAFDESFISALKIPVTVV